MSGNCAIGIAEMAMAPASVMTMAMTTANRGRSMKMLENIVRSVFRTDGRRHDLSRMHFLNPVGDDKLALLESVRLRCPCRARCRS